MISITPPMHDMVAGQIAPPLQNRPRQYRLHIYQNRPHFKIAPIQNRPHINQNRPH